HGALRGDRMHGLVAPHELESFGGIEPVSRANQAAAFFKISRSSRRTLFSRRSRRSSSRSSVVRPSWRWPSSRSAWATQLRIDCAVGSNFSASSSGFRPARTISTSRRLNSGGYGTWDLGIVNSSSLERDLVSTKPGALHYRDGVPLRESSESVKE